jgi:hypothetical protein
MVSREKKNLVIENVLFQAKHFLEHAGEFYPFGTIIDSDDEIRPLGLQMEEDFPKSSEMLRVLKNAVTERIANCQYKCAAIGVDVVVTKNSKKVDALEILFFNSDLGIEKMSYQYSKNGIKYEFELIEV